jgi:hypothetical protein
MAERRQYWTRRRLGRRAGIGTAAHRHRLLGHASIQATEGYLTKPSPDELLDAMARVTLQDPTDR